MEVLGHAVDHDATVLIGRLAAAYEHGDRPALAAARAAAAARVPFHPLIALIDGETARRAGRHRIAEIAARRALSLVPSALVAYHLLALVRLDHGTADGRRRLADRLAAMFASDAEARLMAGRLLAIDRDPGTVAAFGHAASLRPGWAEPLWRAAQAALDADDRPGAWRAARRAAALAPDDPEALGTVGNAAKERGAHETAARAYAAALARQPLDWRLMSNLGVVLGWAGARDAARRWLLRSLALRPASAEIRCNLSTVELFRGSLEEGWRLNELRWLRFGFPSRRLATGARRWEGPGDPARRVMIWAEQGLGDELFFAGLFPEALACIAAPVVVCDARLISLFRRAWPGARYIARPDGGGRSGRVVDLPTVDAQIPAGSLPLLFRRRRDSFPYAGGYLHADPAAVARWRRRLRALAPGPAVGIAWRGGLTGGGRDVLYTALEDWAPVLRVPGVLFVNLQYGDTDAEVASVARRHGISPVTFPDLDRKDDQDGLAALMTALDLVATVGTAVGDLAGALGRPTRLLYGPPHYYKFLGTGRIPFYPTVRPLLRPSPEAPWNGVIHRLAAEISRMGRRATQVTVWGRSGSVMDRATPTGVSRDGQ